MKRFLFISILLTIPLFSLNVGNPAIAFLLNDGVFYSDLSWTHPEVSVLGDYLIEKSYVLDSGEAGFEIHNPRVSGLSELGYLAWSIRERFVLQVYLGSGQYQWRFFEDGSNVSGSLQGGLCYGGDAKCIIFHAKDTIFAIDGQVGAFDFMKGHYAISDQAQNGTAYGKSRYWQVGVGFTQRIGILSPYIGIAMQKSIFNLSHVAHHHLEFSSRHTMGPYVGCSLGSGDIFLINIEWRGLFEQGIGLSGQLRF